MPAVHDRRPQRAHHLLRRRDPLDRVDGRCAAAPSVIRRSTLGQTASSPYFGSLYVSKTSMQRCEQKTRRCSRARDPRRPPTVSSLPQLAAARHLVDLAVRRHADVLPRRSSARRAVGRGGVHRAVGADHDAVVGPGVLDARDELVRHVDRHELRVALQRVAVAAAGRRHEQHLVALVHDDVRELAVRLGAERLARPHPLGLALAAEGDDRVRPVLAVEQAPRLHAVAVGVRRDVHAVGQEAEHAPRAEAAAVAADADLARAPAGTPCSGTGSASRRPRPACWRSCRS